MKDLSINPYLIAIGILILTWLLATIVTRLFNRKILKSSLVLKTDPTNYKYFKHIIRALIYMMGIAMAIYTVPTLRTLSNSIFAGAGILAIAIGFASQHALSNIISGIFLVIFKPFRVNDIIAVGNDIYGEVEDITLRHTIIRNFENQRFIVPNTVISDEVVKNVNFEDDRACKFIEVELDYQEDLRKAEKVLREIVEAHPNLIDNRSSEDKAAGKPLVPVKIIALQASSIKMRAWAWTESFSLGGALYQDVLWQIAERFPKEGIKIPFPQYEVHLTSKPESDK